VRERPATPAEVARRPPLGATPHQEAVLFALRKLTGKDLGPTVNDWRRQFLGRELPVRSWYTGFKAARALAVDGKGRAFVADTGVLLRKEAAARPVLVTKDGAGVAGLAIDGKGGLLMACGRTRQVVRLDLTTKEEKSLGDGRTRLAGPRRLAADAEGGVYVTDGSADGRDGGVYYLSASGRVSPLTVAVPQPRGIALSADGRTLYVAAAGALEVWAYPVEGAGLIGSGRRLVKLAGDGGIPDLAVDRRGLIFALNPAARTVEVLRPDGVRVAIARLTESPVGCALDGSSLHVLTKSGLFTVEITPAGTP
jgi:sugar lactone lactonase YvrE